MPNAIATRLSRLAAIGAAALLLLGAPAAALGQTPEPPCEARYVAQEGDTLHSIARRCDVAMAEIVERNPGLGDPPVIEPGTEIELGAPAEDTKAAARMETYAVEVGDSLQSIARDLGVSIVELMAANPEVDPTALSIGEELAVPGDRPAATVSLIPESGPPGELIALSVGQLRPNDWVTIGVGRQAWEWQPVRDVQVSEDGELSAQVAVPDWAEPGQRLVFLVDTDRGLIFKSAPFVVAEAE
jgi:LysM repeat protein